MPAKIDLDRAVAYIQNEGQPVEHARLAAILHGEPPSDQHVAELTAGQRDDGGWSPFWAADYSSVDATCFRLAQAEQLGLDTNTESIQRAVAFLKSRQHPDGYWEEDESVAESPPPWAMPGAPSARLYLTANCGFWVSALGPPHLANSATEKPAALLAASQQPDGSLPSFLHTHWLATELWQHTQRESEIRAALDYLHTQLDQLSANNITWMLNTFRCVGLLSVGLLNSTTHPLVNEAIDRLTTLQQPDGRWPSDDAMERDVHVTLEAVRVLRTSST